MIRTSFYKYYNPKEVLIQDGIVNRALMQNSARSKLLSYLYPLGATLNVVPPSTAVLSTGTASFPPSRPTCAFYSNQAKGKMVIFGAGHFLTDRYLSKEDNVPLMELFLTFLTDASFTLNSIDSLNPDINDYQMVPDLDILCNSPMLFLEESEELPADYTMLFSKEIKQISNEHLAQVTSTFDEFQIEKRPLRVIKPHFETPLPQLQPAIFTPVFRGLHKPELELFDLDTEFASVQNRLVKLANKCNNNDIEYFISECGHILGLNLNYKENFPKNVIYAVASKIVTFKRINND